MSELYKHASYAEDGTVRMVDGEPVVQLRTAALPWDVSGTLTETQFKKAFGADGSFIKDMAANGYAIECNGWRLVPIQAHRATATDDTASVVFLVNNSVLNKTDGTVIADNTWFMYMLTYEADTIFVECDAVDVTPAASVSGGGL